jgi:hypothetical protein
MPRTTDGTLGAVAFSDLALFLGLIGRQHHRDMRSPSVDLPVIVGN